MSDILKESIDLLSSLPEDDMLPDLQEVHTGKSSRILRPKDKMYGFVYKVFDLASISRFHTQIAAADNEFRANHQYLKDAAHEIAVNMSIKQPSKGLCVAHRCFRIKGTLIPVIKMRVYDKTLLDLLQEGFFVDVHPSVFLDLITSMFTSIRSLANNNIVHMNISPSNIFLNNPIIDEHDKFRINYVLGDFGSAIYTKNTDVHTFDPNVNSDVFVSYFNGPLDFTRGLNARSAPELLLGSTRFKVNVDYWSVGIIISGLIVLGNLPEYHTNKPINKQSEFQALHSRLRAYLVEALLDKSLLPEEEHHPILYFLNIANGKNQPKYVSDVQKLKDLSIDKSHRLYKNVAKLKKNYKILTTNRVLDSYYGGDISLSFKKLLSAVLTESVDIRRNSEKHDIVLSYSSDPSKIASEWKLILDFVCKSTNPVGRLRKLCPGKTLTGHL